MRFYQKTVGAASLLASLWVGAQPVELLNEAQKGNPEAQSNLAVLMVRGLGGVEKNLPEAAKWYLRAAEQGHVTAQVSLAELYESGQGMVDLAQAAHWYQRAAEQDHLLAQSRIATMYH